MAYRISLLPRIPFHAGHDVGKVVPTYNVGVPVGVPGMRTTVAAVLAQREPWPHKWTDHELAQRRWLYLAVLRDLGGADDPGDTRDRTTVNRDVRRGRVEWAALGSWPWSFFGPTGRPGERWWELDFVRDAWTLWLG